MPSLIDVLAAVALLPGTFLSCVACIGLVRFPDVYCRMHAAGKAGEARETLIPPRRRAPRLAFAPG